jgi:hypothetical protein
MSAFGSDAAGAVVHSLALQPLSAVVTMPLGSITRTKAPSTDGSLLRASMVDASVLQMSSECWWRWVR